MELERQEIEQWFGGDCPRTNGQRYKQFESNQINAPLTVVVIDDAVSKGTNEGPPSVSDKAFVMHAVFAALDSENVQRVFATTFDKVSYEDILQKSATDVQQGRIIVLLDIMLEPDGNSGGVNKGGEIAKALIETHSVAATNIAIFSKAGDRTTRTMWDLETVEKPSVDATDNDVNRGLRERVNTWIKKRAQPFKSPYRKEV